MMASGTSTKKSRKNFIELCNRLILLLQTKQIGSNFEMIVGQLVAITDKILEYKSKSKKQHKFLLLKCLN